MHMHMIESVCNSLHKIHWHMGDEPPVVTYNTSLDAWPSLLTFQPDRFVEKVESCIAQTAERDERGVPVDKHHNHSFVRITLVPFQGETEAVILVERKIVSAGHSVIPIVTPAPTADVADADVRTVEDHACIIFDGAHSKFTHQPIVDRRIVFENCKDRQLSLQELAGVFQFISRNGSYTVGEDCAAHSMWFSRTCLAGLKAIMLGAHLSVTPPKGVAAGRLDSIREDAIDSFINHSFKTGYPIRKIADEHRLRQLDALSGIEKEKRKLVIKRYQKDEDRRAQTVKAVHEILKTKYGR